MMGSGGGGGGGSLMLLCYPSLIETLNEDESYTEIIETSNQNNQIQNFESFNINPNSLKLNYRKLR